MNGFLFAMLFGRSRLAYYQSLDAHLSAIEQHLHKVTNVNQESSLHGETILMESFHHASIAAYQAEDEINNTFNYYLVLAGIIAVGLPSVQGLIIQTNERGYRYLPVAFSVTASIILVLVAVLSLFFLERFLQLSKERYDNVKTMNNIQDYYSGRLEAQMPGIDDIFRKQRGKEKSFRVPLVILFTAIVVGSLCIGGSIAIVVSVSSIILFSSIGFMFWFAFCLSYYYIRKRWESNQSSQLVSLQVARPPNTRTSF